MRREIHALSGFDDEGELIPAFEDIVRREGPNFGTSDNDFNDTLFKFFDLSPPAPDQMGDADMGIV
ncbi:MAG: hypothetical protein AAFY56_06025 [Pseudomonadota bacterium]